MSRRRRGSSTRIFDCKLNLVLLVTLHLVVVVTSVSRLNISNQLQYDLEGETEKHHGVFEQELREDTFNRPAAHCAFHPGFGIKARDMTAIQLMCEGESLLLHNMENDGENLVIHVGGYYHVYSQMMFKLEVNQTLDTGEIVHYVITSSSTGPTLLKNLLSTPTIRRGRHAYITSSLGGTFYLEKYSRVYVMSSVPRNIDFSPFGSYIGLYLV